MERKVNIITDLNGKKTVFIQDILFKGRQNIEWAEVEKYIKRYIENLLRIQNRGILFI